MTGDENNTASVTLATGGNVNQSLTNSNVVNGDQIQRQDNRRVLVYQPIININPAICSSKQVAENLCAAWSLPRHIEATFDSEQSMPALTQITENIERNSPKRKSTDQHLLPCAALGPPPTKLQRKNEQTTTSIETLDENQRPIDEPCTFLVATEAVEPDKTQIVGTNLCDPSTFEDFKIYAQKAAPTSVNQNSSKPDETMENIETSVYVNNVIYAVTERDRFFEQMKYQSHPSSTDFKNMVADIPGGKNPVRAALLHAACGWKLCKENPKHQKRAFEIGTPICAISKLVVRLTGDMEKAKTVLDHNLLQNGAHAFDVAEFLVSIIKWLYEIAFADDRSSVPSTSKAYALRWLAVSLRETQRYSEAIELIESNEYIYDGIQNDSTIDIYETLGLCYEEVQDFGRALDNLRKAQTLALTKSYKDNLQNKLFFLDKYIKRVDEVLRRQESAVEN